MQSVLSTNRRRWVLFAAVSLGAILLTWTPPSIVSSKTQARMPQTRTRKVENYDVRDEDSDRQAVMAKHGLQSRTAQERRSKMGDTIVVNPGTAFEGNAAIVDIDEKGNAKAGLIKV